MGRPKHRWMDGVVEDLRKLGNQRWRMVVRDRQAWKKFYGKLRLVRAIELLMTILNLSNEVTDIYSEKQNKNCRHIKRL